MGEQSAQTLAPHTRLPCTACGYDIGGVAAGSACPECGAPVFGFEAAEAWALQQRGMTLVLWGLPGTLLACLLGQVVYLIVGTGEGRSGPVSAQRGAIAMAIVPMMVTLVGLWIAVGPTPSTTLGRWLRRIAILMILIAAVLGAQRLVAHVSPNTFLGYRGTTAVRSYLSTPFYEAGVVKCEDVICWSDAGSCGHCGVARGLVQLSIQAYTVAGLESLAGIVPGAVVLVHFVQGTDAHLG